MSHKKKKTNSLLKILLQTQSSFPSKASKTLFHELIQLTSNDQETRLVTTLGRYLAGFPTVAVVVVCGAEVWILALTRLPAISNTYSADGSVTYSVETYSFPYLPSPPHRTNPIQISFCIEKPYLEQIMEFGVLFAFLSFYFCQYMFVSTDFKTMKGLTICIASAPLALWLFYQLLFECKFFFFFFFFGDEYFDNVPILILPNY